MATKRFATTSKDGQWPIQSSVASSIITEFTNHLFTCVHLQASDNPVKARFVPLGEFIKKVGPAPSDVAMVTYLQRLKEQGWNVDRTERKMLMCGVKPIADAKAEANALAGATGASSHLHEHGTACYATGWLL